MNKLILTLVTLFGCVLLSFSASASDCGRKQSVSGSSVVTTKIGIVSIDPTLFDQSSSQTCKRLPKTLFFGVENGLRDVFKEASDACYKLNQASYDGKVLTWANIEHVWGFYTTFNEEYKNFLNDIMSENDIDVLVVWDRPDSDSVCDAVLEVTLQIYDKRNQTMTTYVVPVDTESKRDVLAKVANNVFSKVKETEDVVMYSIGE